MMKTAFKNRLTAIRQKLSWKSLAKVVAGLAVFYLLFGYFAVNPIAKKLVPSIAEKSLASKASVARVQFDPLRFKLTVNDFKLANLKGESLARFNQLIVDLELSGIFDLAWKFKQVSIVEPEINLAIAENGQLNWDGLMAKLNENPSPPSDTIPRVIVEQVLVNQGKVEYADKNRATPINTTLTPLSFQLKGFSTLPKDRGDYLISAVFADSGGSLKWKGDMGVNPVASKGVVALDGIKVAEALRLIKGLTLPIQLTSGDVNTSFNYDFSVPNTIPTLVLNNIRVGLADMAGDLVDGGKVALTHAVLTAPQLDFVSSQQPTLQVKNLDFKLSGLSFAQDHTMQIALKESTATLPQLDFSLQEKPQLVFQDLNLTLTDFNVEKGHQFTLTVPTAAVNTVGLDLAENNVSIQELVLSNLRFEEGAKSDAGKAAIKPLATLKSITITDGAIALADQQVNVQSLVMSGFETDVVRNADNTLNWLKVFEEKESVARVEREPQSSDAVAQKADVATAAASTPARAWDVALKKVAIDQSRIHIEDKSTPTPVKLDIVKASIEIQNASLDVTKPLPVQAAFIVKQGGRFSTKGTLWPSPLKVDLGLRLSKLSLKPFAPYVNQHALLKLSNGDADVSGQIVLKQQQDLKMSFKGNFGVKQFALVEEADGAPFLSWDSLGSKDLKVSLMPNKLQMATLQIRKPAGKFIIYEDKTMNVQRILRNQATSDVEPMPESAVKPESITPVAASDSLIKPVLTPQSVKASAVKVAQAEPAPSTKAAATSADVFPVKIDSVRIDDGKLEFADLSLTPQFGTNIHSLNGVINGLSTKAETVSQVEMDGKVDTYGSARIRGTLQPFNATDFTDIKLAFTNVDMSRLTPYSGKFAGRRIDSGKLSVDLAYKIKQHQLAGENKFVINKLKLGERVESADAADLPLDLAIAILEDSDGVIDLDLPISGSLDDPEFSYGSIVWKAIRNVLTKIVTAPFRALGKLFGGDGQDFDGIAFEAGVSEVSPPELEKLAQVSEALAKRQGLSLGILPSYHKQLDTQAIKEATYRQLVAEEMGLELVEGQRAGPVDLSNEKVQGAVDALYNKLTKKGFLKRMVSKFEKPEDGHYEKAQTSLIDSIEVTDEDLKALAVARGNAIQEALLQNGVSTERVSTMELVDAKATDDRVKVELKLDVKQSNTQSSEPKAEETPAAEPSSPALSPT